MVVVRDLTISAVICGVIITLMIAALS
jgi:hypothetical protein